MTRYAVAYPPGLRSQTLHMVAHVGTRTTAEPRQRCDKSLAQSHGVYAPSLNFRLRPGASPPPLCSLCHPQAPNCTSIRCTAANSTRRNHWYGGWWASGGSSAAFWVAKAKERHGLGVAIDI